MPRMGRRRNQMQMNHARITALIPGLKDMEPGDYRKLESGGFMPLHVDILDKHEEWMRFSMAHNGKQNGDNMADPDMEIKYYTDPRWDYAEALTWQNDYVGLYHVVYPEPGKVYPRMKKELNSFLTQWLKNLENQGHKVIASESL